MAKFDLEESWKNVPWFLKDPLDHAWERQYREWRVPLRSLFLDGMNKCHVHTLSPLTPSMYTPCESRVSRELKYREILGISNKVKLLIPPLTRDSEYFNGPIMSTPSTFDSMCTGLESSHIFLVNKKVGKLCYSIVFEAYITKTNTDSLGVWMGLTWTLCLRVMVV